VIQKRPSRAYVLGVYAKRFLRWQRTSYPFLTIDAFATLADYRFNPVRWRLSERNVINIVNAEVIFCKSEELEILFRSHPDIQAKVIICGNSDFEFHKIPSGIPKSVRALFLQNSFISDNRSTFTLPIGLENFRWGVNGNPKLFDSTSKKSVKDEILFGPFGKTHSIRQEVIKELMGRGGPWSVLPPERISPVKYSTIVKKYRYVAAVRGNGIDTHRLWESLYRGIIPIVQDDDWSQSLKYLNLPIRFVKNWNTELLRIEIANSPPQSFNSSDYECLWMPYWEKKISSFLD
jgi:hypothetical protein